MKYVIARTRWLDEPGCLFYFAVCSLSRPRKIAHWSPFLNQDAGFDLCKFDSTDDAVKSLLRDEFGRTLVKAGEMVMVGNRITYHGAFSKSNPQVYQILPADRLNP